MNPRIQLKSFYHPPCCQILRATTSTKASWKQTRISVTRTMQTNRLTQSFVERFIYNLTGKTFNLPTINSIECVRNVDQILYLSDKVHYYVRSPHHVARPHHHRQTFLHDFTSEARRLHTRTQLHATHLQAGRKHCWNNTVRTFSKLLLVALLLAFVGSFLGICVQTIYFTTAILL